MSPTKPIKSKKNQDPSVLDEFFSSTPRDILPAYKAKTPLERFGLPLLVAIVAFAAYIPSFDNAFVSWDDDHYLYNNQQVILADGWKSCLFDRTFYSDEKFRGNRPKSEKMRVSHQYYPLLFTTHWLEFQVYKGLFGEEKLLQDGPLKPFQQMTPAAARCFHVTSAAWHSVNVLVLIALLRLLGINTWAATLAAALFALTPVNVATVAWASERKNILSMMFYMLAMMSYVHSRRSVGRDVWIFFVLSLLLHIFGLMSKTVVVTFPLMLIVTDRLLDGRWTFRSCLRSVPFFLFSGVATIGTILVEEGRKRSIPNEGPIRLLTMWDTMRFYIQKAILPVHLSPIYRLWDTQVDLLRGILSTVGIAALAGVLWRFRKKIPAHAYWGLAFYVITVLPMLGLKNINYFQFALVADHYFYHCSIGLFVAIAVLVDWLRRSIKPSMQSVVAAVMVVVCLLFGAGTWAETSHWENTPAYWNRVKEMNSTCWPAYFNMGNQYLREARAVHQQAGKILKDGEPSEQELAEATELLYKARDLYRTSAENFSDAGLYFCKSKGNKQMYTKAYENAEGLYNDLNRKAAQYKRKFGIEFQDDKLINDGLDSLYRRWSNHYYELGLSGGAGGLHGLAKMHERDGKHLNAAIVYYDLLNVVPYYPSASTGLLANILELDDVEKLFDRLKKRPKPGLVLGKDYSSMMARAVVDFYVKNDAISAKDLSEKVIASLQKRKVYTVLPWFVLADIYKSEGDLEKAYNCNQNAKMIVSQKSIQKKDRDGYKRVLSSILVRQAQIREAQGQRHEAAELAKEAVRMSPQNTLAREMLKQYGQ